jgi:hypothetical protein
MDQLISASETQNFITQHVCVFIGVHNFDDFVGGLAASKLDKGTYVTCIV